MNEANDSAVLVFFFIVDYFHQGAACLFEAQRDKVRRTEYLDAAIVYFDCVLEWATARTWAYYHWLTHLARDEAFRLRGLDPQ